MRIKRFVAPDSKAALAMVKEELGPDAVILAHRPVNRSAAGGAVKTYGKTYVEVVAAMDYDVAALTAVGDAPVASAPVRERPEPVAPPRSAMALPRAQRGPQKEGPAQAGDDRQRQVSQWRDQIIDRLRYCSLLPKKGGPQRVIALVGATGVGKTTTVAKLAAWAHLHGGHKVALVSMDCYRIGATDQLRTYARIMGLRCEVALRPGDLARGLARLGGHDLVLVDTAGKSPYDSGHIDELRQWFAAAPGIEPYLTLSATTKREDLATVLEVYRGMAQGAMITKVDETRAYAYLCQQLAATDLPIACLGTGQRVPEDFVPANAALVGCLFRQGWQSFVAGLAA